MSLKLGQKTNTVSSLKKAQWKAYFSAAIAASIEEAVIGTTLRGTITSWNKGAERLYGYREQEVLGKSIALLIPENRHSEIIRVLRKIKNGEYVEHYETTRIRKDGAAITVAVNVSPIKNDKGQVIGISAIVRDVGQENLMKAKEEFLFRTIHDLRVPTHIIQMLLAENEEKGPEGEYSELKKNLDLIQNANTRMARLIEYLFEFAKGKKNEITLEKTLIPIDGILRAAIRELNPLLQKRNVRIFYTEHALPAVLGDKDALDKVFTNILDNAIKYNWENGKIMINTRKQKNTVIVMVKDTGIGVEKKYISKLFQPYFRAYEGTDVQGTGLGLFIVKGLVEKMGGKIKLSSTVGRGTTVTVALPCSPP